MDSSERIQRLHEQLERVADARSMATTPVWAEAWDAFERELLDRMIAATDPEAVMRLKAGMEAARAARRAIEHKSKTADGLEKELDLLEGRRIARVA